jgi:hypothetical protein
VEDQDKLWETMLKSNDIEFGPLLTAGIYTATNSKTEREVELNTGLYGRHAYSITGVQEIDIDGNSSWFIVAVEPYYTNKSN